MIADEIFGWRKNRYDETIKLLSKCSFEGDKLQIYEVQKDMLWNMLMNQFTIDVREKKMGKTFCISMLGLSVLINPLFRNTDMDIISLGQRTGNQIIYDIAKIRRDTEWLEELLDFDEDNKSTILCRQTGSKVRSLPPTLGMQGIRPNLLVIDEYSEWYKNENLGKELDTKIYREVIIGSVFGVKARKRFTELKIITNGGRQEGNCWELVKKASTSQPLFRWGSCLENQEIVKLAIEQHFKLDWVKYANVSMSGDEHEIKFNYEDRWLSFVIGKDEKNNKVKLEISTNKGTKFNCFAEYVNDDIQINASNENETGWVIKYQPWQKTNYDINEINILKKELGPVDFAIYHECAFLPHSDFSINHDAVLRNVYQISVFDSKRPCYAALDLGKKKDKSSLVVIQPYKGKIAIVGIFETKEGYDSQKRLCIEKIKEFKIESLVVDSTSGETFVDLCRDDFAKIGCFIIPESFVHNRSRIFSAVKREIETIDEYGKGGLMIPEYFNSLITDLQGASPDEHMPDSIAALGMILNKMRYFEDKTEGMIIGYSERKPF